MAKIFTTEFSTAFEGVAAGGDKTTTGEGFASGVGVTGGGLVSAGAAKAGAIVRQKIKEPAKADVMAKTSEVRSILIGQRNSIRERKRASFFKIGDRCSRHQRCRLQEIVGRAFLPAIPARASAHFSFFREFPPQNREFTSTRSRRERFFSS